MRKKALIGILACIFVITVSSGAMALTIDLFDWAFNVNGTTYESLAGTNDPSILPSAFNDSGFDWVTGLGTLTVDFSAPGPGTYSFLSFFDHEIDEPDNTFFNEYGDVSVGVPVAGQSWEIDEPGYVFGDIYTNFLAGSLDNSNGVPANLPDDVSMAMGWAFALGDGESALITLALSDVAPAGFHLRHTDPDSDASIYFSSSLDISGPHPVPEPGTLLLMAVAMVTLIFVSRRWRRA
jgi:hypothetical protein